VCRVRRGAARARGVHGRGPVTGSSWSPWLNAALRTALALLASLLGVLLLLTALLWLGGSPRPF
jgi:hypothetical protein